jgi:hypothetical protein
VIDPKSFQDIGQRVLPFNSILLAMNNTLLIVYVENNLAHGVLQNTPIKVLISF